MKHLTINEKSFLYLIIIVAMVSCSKQQVATSPQRVNYDLAIKNEAQKFMYRNIFGEVLAKSITKSQALRTLIKNMASEKFDGIADILYCDISNKVVDGLSVNDYLKQFADDKNLFQTAVNQSALLTIYVPSLPKNWDVTSWNAQKEIPKVAIEKNYADSKNTINFYNEEGKMEMLSDTLIPGFATLVIKENSRICTKDYADVINRTYTKGSDFPVVYEQINGQELYYLSASLKNAASQLSLPDVGRPLNIGSGSRTNTVYSSLVLGAFSPDVVDAYNLLGTSWPRDYIYYGLTPTTPSGPLNNRNAERIAYFSFSSNAILSQISTEPTDPQLVMSKSDPNNSSWTTGSYHITFTILNNAKNGTGQTFQKSAFLTPDQVWATTYQNHVSFNIWGTPHITWDIASITPISVPINVDLVPFDISNYSIAWKIIVEDTRPTSVVTYKTMYSSQFAENFALDNSVGLFKKIGLKLGASATQTSTEEHTVTTTLTSISLGDIILNYSDPVITSRIFNIGGFNYRTLDYSTGYGSAIVSIVPWRQW